MKVERNYGKALHFVPLMAIFPCFSNKVCRIFFLHWASQILQPVLIAEHVVLLALAWIILFSAFQVSPLLLDWSPRTVIFNFFNHDSE